MKPPKGHAMNEDVMNKEDAQSVDVRKVERALTHLHVLVTSSHNAGWQANRDAWDVIRAALAHPCLTGEVKVLTTQAILDRIEAIAHQADSACRSDDEMHLRNTLEIIDDDLTAIIAAERVHAPTVEQAGEVIYQCRHSANHEFPHFEDCTKERYEQYKQWGHHTRIVYTAQPRPVGVPDGPLTGKYANVLVPFVALMERELHANAGKGDRDGWLAMTPQVAMLEIHHHVAKLQKAALNGDITGVCEYAADVANMSMMAVDVCGALIDVEPAPAKAGE